MRVAFFLHEFPRISETFILSQITGLIDRGCTVDIYAHKADDAPLHADVKRYNLLEKTTYYKLDKHMMPANMGVRIIKALQILIRNLTKNPAPLLRSLNPALFTNNQYSGRVRSLWLFYATAMFLDYGIDQYDAVHCHFGPQGNGKTFLKINGAIKGRFLTTFYGFDVNRHVELRGKRVYDGLFEHTDHILALSNVMREQLIKLGCPEDKAIVHRLGVDPEEFRFSPRLPKAGKTVNLLTISRLVEKKGVEYGIRAVAKVLREYPQISYQIAGEGPLRPELEQLIRELEVEKQVTLLGWQQKADMIDLLSKTDVLLAPSVVASDGDEEGTPTALVEASARGIPVISTWHSGIPEVVQDGQSGYLVPERDADALAEKLMYLLTHQDCWSEMGDNGRQHVLSHFDVNNLNGQLIELYQTGTKRMVAS